jgi:hypothetical protein
MPDKDPIKYFQSEIKRLNYYNSQFLKENDFNDEQLYHNQMRRFHNRALHTWGIVQGLEVAQVSDTASVTVSPGIAIDRLGQEIVLPETSDKKILDAFAAGAKVYVTIRYADVFDINDKDTKASQTASEYYMRWTERPAVSVTDAAPDDKAPDVVLAVVTLDNQKAIAQVDRSVRRYAGGRFGSSDSGAEFSLYADTAGAWHFFDGGKQADRLTVDSKGTLKVTGGDLQLDAGRELFFKDGGQIRSGDDNHRILFRRSENKLELREFGDIVFSPGATAGGETAKVVMSGGGNVGIGRSPGTKLDVNGPVWTQTLQFTDGNGAVYPDNWLGMADNIDGATKWLHIGGITDGGERRLAFAASRIYAAGNVGIGTATPAYKLDVQGGFLRAAHNTQAFPASSPAGGLAIGWNRTGGSAEVNFYNVFNSAGRAFQFSQKTGDDTANDLLTIAGNGNVGIGTSQTAGRLNISEATGTTHGPNSGTVVIDHENNGGASSIVFRSKVNRGSDYGFIQFQDADTVGGAGEKARLVIGINNDADDHLILQPSGNVGIGTTAPLYKLHVVAPGGFAAEDGDGVANAAGNVPIIAQSNGTAFGIINGGGRPAFALNIDSEGGTKAARGVPTFYDRYDGNWHAALSLKNGNVGVGTSAPGAKLHVVGGAIMPEVGNFSTAGIQFPSDPGGGAGDQAFIRYYAVTGETTKLLIGIENDPDDTIGLWQQGGERMTVYSGRVGIGTTTPSKGLLEVNGSVNTTLSGYGYTNRNGASSTNDTFTSPYSIWASQRMAATEFNAFSDERIKNIRGRSDGAADLRTLLAIEVTDYIYRDVIGKGSAPRKKVVAQQVEKVFPQAVSVQTDVVPDIYRLASVADGWVALATDLKKGERVRLISEKTEGVYEVLEATGDKFRTDFKPEGDEVFVFGREVGDFRTLDYDAIAMLNVSATQQLKKEMDEEVQALRAENAEMRAANDALLERLRILESRAEALPNLAAPKKGPNGNGRH